MGIDTKRYTNLPIPIKEDDRSPFRWIAPFVLFIFFLMFMLTYYDQLKERFTKGTDEFVKDLNMGTTKPCDAGLENLILTHFHASNKTMVYSIFGDGTCGFPCKTAGTLTFTVVGVRRVKDVTGQMVTLDVPITKWQEDIYPANYTGNETGPNGYRIKSFIDQDTLLGLIPEDIYDLFLWAHMVGGGKKSVVSEHFTRDNITPLPPIEGD